MVCEEEQDGEGGWEDEGDWDGEEEREGEEEWRGRPRPRRRYNSSRRRFGDGPLLDGLCSQMRMQIGRVQLSATARSNSAGRSRNGIDHHERGRGDGEATYLVARVPAISRAPHFLIFRGGQEQ